MDSNEEIERILERMEQNADENSKETVALLKQMAKSLQTMSEEQRKAFDVDVKNRRQDRLRDDARSRRDQAAGGSGGSSSGKNSFGKSVDGVKNSLGKVGKGLDGFAGMLTITTDSLHDMVGVLKMFPIVGGLVATALGSLVINGIQTTIDSFRQLNKHGIVFGDSIFDVNTAAVNAGMSIKEFADVVSRYGVVVNAYGIDAIMGFSKELASSGSELRKLGMTTKDITEYTLDYLEMRRNLGEQDVLDRMNEAETRESAENFARSLYELSVQTGKSLDELRKGATTRNVDLDLALAGNANADQIKAFVAANPSMMKPVLDLLTKGVSSELNSLGVVPGMDKFQQAVNDLVFGMGSASSATSALTTASVNASDDIKLVAVRASETNPIWGFIKQALADGQANLATDNIKMTALLSRRQNLLERSNKVDEQIQAIRSAILVPFYEGLGKIEEQVDWEKLEESLKGLGSAVGDMIKRVFTKENIDLMAGFVNGLVDAVAGMVNFLKGAFDRFGIVGLGLTFVFGLMLPKLLVGVVGAMLKGGAGMALAGGKSMLGGIGIGGKSIGTGFLTKLGGLGIGAALATAVGIAINGTASGEAVGAAVGSGVGTFVGGFIGTFFGPLGTLAGMTLGGFLGDMLGGALGQAMYKEKDQFLTDAEKELKAKLAESQKQLEAAHKAVSEAKTPEQLEEAKSNLDAAQTTTNTLSNENVAIDERQAAISQAMDFMVNNLTMQDMLNEANMSPEGYNGFRQLFDNSIRDHDYKAMQELILRLSKMGSSTATDLYNNLSNEGLLYASGGIANRPSIFAEAGPEAAIPLDSGMRIPIAEIGGLADMQQAIEQSSAGDQVLLQTMDRMRQSMDRFLNFMQSTNTNREELEVLLGIYGKLNDISGSSSAMARNFRSMS